MTNFAIQNISPLHPYIDGGLMSAYLKHLLGSNSNLSFFGVSITGNNHRAIYIWFVFGDHKCKFTLSSILRNFSEYTTTEGYGVTVGPVSGSLYYMYHLQSQRISDLNFDIIHIQCAQNKRIKGTSNQS